MAAVRGWDAFAAVEAEVRAMVEDPRWQGLPTPARGQALCAMTLVTPDGGRWLFGAHARWYLHDPVDGRWHLAAPPRGCETRRPAHRAQPPAPLPHLLPGPADFTGLYGSTQAFIGPDVHPDLTEEVRVLLRAMGRKSETDFPLSAFAEVFADDVPGTVAAIWGTIMWCAHAPAFDGNERLITIFGEYLRHPLPGDEWVRWLSTPPLTDLAALYAERVRADAPRSALRLLALMADTAQILAADARFSPRATALLAMLEPALARPGLDDAAAREDDLAVRQAWLSRCPPRFGRWLLRETDRGTDFRHTVYDLVEALAFTTDPPRAAASFLTDLPGAGERLHTWLDHRVRHAYTDLTRHVAAYGENTEPDGFAVPAFLWDGPTGGWPNRATAPATARGVVVAPPDRESAASVLGAAYASALAWCGLVGAEVPADGFAGARAIVRRLVHERDDH
ncbi:hypothetical protein [Nonomuraea longicatena]|uniref:Uncharacterized protein n=1 Tax=Nonomuraea longicatena TaxID=83682 RepID=A0ABN1PSS4_9ACTN